VNVDKFLGASLSLREASIEVPELAEFFEDGEDAVWVVRGLTAVDLGRAGEESQRSENIEALVSAVSGEGDKVDAIRKAFGISGKDVPADVSRRIAILAAGSVSPALGEDRRDVAVRLAETFPTTFYTLTNKILSLTGEGAELGKRKGSGKAAASARS